MIKRIFSSISAALIMVFSALLSIYAVFDIIGNFVYIILGYSPSSKTITDLNILLISGAMFFFAIVMVTYGENKIMSIIRKVCGVLGSLNLLVLAVALMIKSVIYFIVYFIYAIMGIVAGAPEIAIVALVIGWIMAAIFLFVAIVLVAFVTYVIIALFVKSNKKEKKAIDAKQTPTAEPVAPATKPAPASAQKPVAPATNPAPASAQKPVAPATNPAPASAQKPVEPATKPAPASAQKPVAPATKPAPKPTGAAAAAAAAAAAKASEAKA